MSRFVAFAVVFVVLMGPGPASADSGPTVPSAPTGLAMTVSGTTKQIPAASWIAANKIDLQLQIQVTSGKVTPEVEIEPSSVAFTGKPNFQGKSVTVSGTASVPVQGLLNGKQYHWQARVTDSAGAPSPWVAYSATGTTTWDVGVDLEAPQAPVVSSATDPKQDRWYRNRVVSLHWAATDRLSGIRGYAFVLSKQPRAVPPGSITSTTDVRITNLTEGRWFLAVSALDRAGNSSAISRFRLQLDRIPPHVAWLSPSRFAFNPYKGATTIRFRVSEVASVHLDLYRVGARTPVHAYWFPHLAAGKVTAITWTGKSRAGLPLPRGYYFFSVRASDVAGNLNRVDLGGIELTPDKPQLAVSGIKLYPGDGKKIVVVLSQETLYAYDGNRLALKSLVTTGNPALPTPAGSYHVMAKYHPFQFVSPWPLGSPFWYAPSWSQFAMLFREGGYFLHDAPWRGAFGPGTNGPGQPGTNYGGTHGCVNIPPGAMSFLWNWTSIGTTVLVVS